MKNILKSYDNRIGENLKSLRLSAVLTQAELAQKIKITFQQMQKYDRGSNRISSSTLFYLLELLNIYRQPLFGKNQTWTPAER